MFKVSIIIPAYNTADVINRTLKSVENQTYQNYELIIINDGSTDETKKIIDNYKQDKSNVIVHHQNNQGVSIARNKGIELATGEFICFLDSDDTYEPEFLEAMLKRQEETGGDVIYCGFNQVDKSGNSEKRPDTFSNGNILKLYYTDGCFIHFSGILVNRNILLKHNIHFEPGRKISEDVLFTVKLFNLCDAYAVEKYLLNYLYRENSAINSKWSDDTWLSDINGSKKVLTYLNENYNKFDKIELLNAVRFRLLRREIDFLYNKMLKRQFDTINIYIEENDFIDVLRKNIHALCKGDRKKSSYIISKNYLTLFWGYFYYKFLRFNFKNFTQN
jgi:glycosyltransferase involved in cell wall biosynthesis